MDLLDEFWADLVEPTPDPVKSDFPVYSRTSPKPRPILPRELFPDADAWRNSLVLEGIDYFTKNHLDENAEDFKKFFEESFLELLKNFEGFARVLFQSTIAALFRSTLGNVLTKDELKESDEFFFLNIMNILSQFSSRYGEDFSKFAKWRLLFENDPWQLDIRNRHVVTLGQFISFYPGYKGMYSTQWTPVQEEKRNVFRKQLAMADTIINGGLDGLSWTVLGDVAGVELDTWEA